MKEFIVEHFFEQGIWIVLTYVLVVVAMAVDLVTGVRKSRLLGRKLNSRGYKRTCSKALNYFLPMLCLSCIDLLGSVVVSFPVLTMFFGAYCVFCELKSVMESTHDKREIQEDLRDLMSLGEDLAELRKGWRRIRNEELGIRNEGSKGKYSDFHEKT